MIDYAASIPQIASAIRRNVSKRIDSMTGLETKEVNINIADIYIAGQDAGQPQPAVVR